ncbi:hypothetical protein [Amycolatopsis benzoatilytica]|uniref:hypothetical protein n=1 Tax=Amycolatopsis benzoatilytica TaxID=346045 RepID=UPI0003689357|nr:hypothetical protein [Amycolatopsis benzoatilytica]
MTITDFDLRHPAAPSPRRPIEQPRRLRMTWEPLIDENGVRRLRVCWRRER